MLTSTKGVMMYGELRVTLETFTVSGSTITPSGVINPFLNALQIPAPTGYGSGSHSLTRASDTEVYVTGVLTTTNPTVFSMMAHWTAVVGVTSVTATTHLQQETEVGIVPFTKAIEGKGVTVYRKDGAGNGGGVLVNTFDTTPVAEISIDVGNDPTFSFPEFDSVNGGVLVVAYEGDTGVEALTARVVL